MDELAALGLQERQDGPRPEPNSDRAKGHLECRTRGDALDFYGDSANWKSGFLSEELAVATRDLDGEVTARLRYAGSDPVGSWK